MKNPSLPRILAIASVLLLVVFGLFGPGEAPAQSAIGGGLVAAPLELGGCSPAERQSAVDDARKLAPIVVSSGCLLLELVDDAGVVQKGCLVAEDLAKLLEAARPPPEKSTMVNAAIQVRVPRAPPRRHCAQWIYVDAGADAATTDAASSPKDAATE